MQLAIDAVGAKTGGAATVVLDFLDAAIADTRVRRVTVFCSPRSLRCFDLPKHSKLIQQEQTGAEISRVQRVLWHEVGLGQACERAHADVVFCMSNAGRGTRYVPHVTLIQQSLPFSAEALQYLRTSERLRMRIVRESMKRSCLTACRVIAQTPVMADWISSAFHLPKDRIEVSTLISAFKNPEGTPAEVLDPMRAAPKHSRFLYIGNAEQHKKIDTLIKGLQIVRRQMPDAQLFLTLPATHPYSNTPGAVCLGYLEKGAVYEAYKLATALALASCTESQGLPLLESMQMGTPVLVSDRPYAHSICEDAALFFDPCDPSDFANRAMALVQDAQLRRFLVQKGSELAQRRIAAHPYEHILDVLCECAHHKGFPGLQ